MYRKHIDFQEKVKEAVNNSYGDLGKLFSPIVAEYLKEKLDDYSYSVIKDIFDELTSMQDALEKGQKGSLEELQSALDNREGVKFDKEVLGILGLRVYTNEDASEFVFLTSEEAEYIDQYPKHFYEVLNPKLLNEISFSTNLYLYCSKKRYDNLDDLKHDYLALKMAGVAK